MALSRFTGGFLIVGALVITVTAPAFAQIPDLAEIELNIQKACPKQWEDLYSDIELNPNVLDVWQGDLTDKAQFIQYANEVDGDGNARLLDAQGNLLIDSYNDVVTIMTECGAQRVAYYKAIREHIGSTIGDMVSTLTGQTAFGRNSIASGVDYENWVAGSTTPVEETVIEPINLAIGRNTTQSGTSSDELSDVETELSDDEYADLAEGQGYAVKAVDNDTNGNFANGSVTHTGFQNQPYWEVDLDDISRIDSITIYNRTDCCQNRLSNFSILVGTRPIDARNLNAAKALDGVTAVKENQSISGNSETFAMPEGTKGRYVRIQLSGNDTVLSLAEVEIMGNVIEKNL